VTKINKLQFSSHKPFAGQKLIYFALQFVNADAATIGVIEFYVKQSNGLYIPLIERYRGESVKPHVVEMLGKYKNFMSAYLKLESRMQDETDNDTITVYDTGKLYDPNVNSHIANRLN